MAEEDSEEERSEKEELLAAAVAKIQAGYELLLERRRLDRELDHWLRSQLRSYLDAEAIEDRRVALGTILEILKDEAEGSDPQLQDDLREWLSQLGFTFVDDAATLCGVPDDGTLAWRIDHAPEFWDVCPLSLAEDPTVAGANVDWFCEDPNELRRISEALEAEDPQKALQLQDAKRFLGDVRRAIELEEDPEGLRKLQRLAESLKGKLKALQNTPGEERDEPKPEA